MNPIAQLLPAGDILLERGITSSPQYAALLRKFVRLGVQAGQFACHCGNDQILSQCIQELNDVNVVRSIFQHGIERTSLACFLSERRVAAMKSGGAGIDLTRNAFQAHHAVHDRRKSAFFKEVRLI
jgi:hypothetical protein